MCRATRLWGNVHRTFTAIVVVLLDIEMHSLKTLHHQNKTLLVLGELVKRNLLAKRSWRYICTMGWIRPMASLRNTLPTRNWPQTMARAIAMARRRYFGHKGRPGCLAAHLAQTMEAAGGELRAPLDQLHRRLHALGFAVEEPLAPLADDSPHEHEANSGESRSVSGMPSSVQRSMCGSSDTSANGVEEESTARQSDFGENDPSRPKRRRPYTDIFSKRRNRLHYQCANGPACVSCKLRSGAAGAA